MEEVGMLIFGLILGLGLGIVGTDLWFKKRLQKYKEDEQKKINLIEEQLEKELERRLDEERDAEVEAEDEDEDEADAIFKRWTPGPFPQPVRIIIG